jgi:hypothetical protein
MGPRVALLLAVIACGGDSSPHGHCLLLCSGPDQIDVGFNSVIDPDRLWLTDIAICLNATCETALLTGDGSRVTGPDADWLVRIFATETGGTSLTAVAETLKVDAVDGDVYRVTISDHGSPPFVDVSGVATYTRTPQLCGYTGVCIGVGLQLQ